MAEFSTSAMLDVRVSSRALRRAREKVERGMSDVTVGVETTSGGYGKRQARDSAFGRRLQSRTIDAIDGVADRLGSSNDYLSQLVESVSSTNDPVSDEPALRSQSRGRTPALRTDGGVPTGPGAMGRATRGVEPDEALGDLVDFADEGIDLARDRNEYLLELIDTMEKGGFTDARNGGAGSNTYLLGGGGLLGGLAAKGKGLLGGLIGKGKGAVGAAGGLLSRLAGGAGDLGGGLLRMLGGGGGGFFGGLVPRIFEGASRGIEDLFGTNPLDGLFDGLSGGSGPSGLQPALITAPDWVQNLRAELGEDLRNLEFPDFPQAPDLSGLSWPSFPTLPKLSELSWPGLPDVGAWWTENTKGLSWPGLPDVGAWWEKARKGLGWPGFPKLEQWWNDHTPNLSWPSLPDLGTWWTNTVGELSWPALTKPEWLDGLFGTTGDVQRDAEDTASDPLGFLDKTWNKHTPDLDRNSGDARSSTSSNLDSPQNTTRSATVAVENNTEFSIDERAIVRELKKAQRQDVKDLKRRLSDLERSLKRI